MSLLDFFFWRCSWENVKSVYLVLDVVEKWMVLDIGGVLLGFE